MVTLVRITGDVKEKLILKASVHVYQKVQPGQVTCITTQYSFDRSSPKQLIEDYIKTGFVHEEELKHGR